MRNGSTFTGPSESPLPQFLDLPRINNDAIPLADGDAARTRGLPALAYEKTTIADPHTRVADERTGLADAGMRFTELGP